MPGTNWKKISSRKVFQHPRLTLIEDEVLIRGGVKTTKTTYLRFGNTGNSVTVICRRADGKILVQEEYSYPTGKSLLQFPGGFVPKREAVVKGAARELAEEAGLRARHLKSLGSYFTNNRRSNARMFVYLAEDLSKTPARPDPEEQIESHWMKESEIEDLLARGKIKNYSFLAAWALYQSRKGTNGGARPGNA